MKFYNIIFSKEKWKNIFSNMEIKDYLTLFFMILSIIIMLCIYLFPIQPTEKIGDNPTIHLENALMSPEILYDLEKYKKDSFLKDEVKYMNLDKDRKIFTLRLLETDDSKRFIIILLADPNNIIRYSNIEFNEKSTIDFDIHNITMHPISNEKNIKIKIPPYDKYYIYGNWHLNVYIYNQKNELTTVISKQID